jgi:hypothetical protein
LLHETSILATQTIVERMQSITSDVNAQSTTSTTPKKHNEIKTSTWQEGEAQPWLKTLIPKQIPTKIGAQSLQLIKRFL